MTKKATFDPARELELFFRCNRNGSKDFVFLDSDGLPYSLIYEDVEFNIYRNQGDKKVLIQLGVSYANNIVSTSITDDQSNINEGKYYWELYRPYLGKTWVTGYAHFHNGVFDGDDSDGESVSIVVSDSGDVVQITVNGDRSTRNHYYDITFFGASADATNNAAAINSAILSASLDENAIVWVPKGVFYIRRTSDSDIVTLLSDVYIDGEGEIRFIGSLASSDTFMFKIGPGTSNVSIKNITLDGGRGSVTNTSEQNHIVEINAGSTSANIEGIKFENVKFKNAVSDCIRMVGTDNATNRVQYGWVKNCTFDNCGRSGITIQRAVRYFDIIGNHFTNISDQFVDMEPSGVAPPNNIKIHDNTCVNTSDKVSLSIAGISDVDGRHAYNISVQGNTIISGGVVVVYCNDVIFLNNVIIAGNQRGIDISRLCFNINITENTITSSAKGIYLAATTNSQYPNSVVIEQNKIAMSGGNGIEMDGNNDTIIEDNIIKALSSSINGVAYRSTVTNDSDLDKRVLINENIIDGFTTGVNINASPNNISKCKIVDNILKNLTNGVAFAVSGGTIDSVVVNNIIDNVTNEFSGLSNTAYIQYSGTPGNVGHYSVVGTPEGAVTAPVGSFATNRTNGDIYYKATGIGNTGWVLK